MIIMMMYFDACLETYACVQSAFKPYIFLIVKTMEQIVMESSRQSTQQCVDYYCANQSLITRILENIESALKTL